MRAPLRLGLFAAALVGVFVAAFGGGRVLVPSSAADGWGAEQGTHAASDSEREPADAAHSGSSVKGVASSENGYSLQDVSAPAVVGEPGTLAFVLTGPDGARVTDYTTQHEKDLHLIVVRTDGAEFRHVHPTLASDGTWSIPWTWRAAGGYRIFADFLPRALDESLTLTSSLHVGGDVATSPVPPASTVVTTGPYEVTVHGELVAGAASELAFSITRDGAPVVLEPYLGANGHLVALRTGDLAYLHVHPEHGDATDAATVSFAAEVPTIGDYLLYLDVKIDGQVHTAAFAATASTTVAPGNAGSGHAGRDGRGDTDTHAETDTDHGN
ncbi:heavy-metal-associated domain-containing protein [Agromyces sp. Marseille-P2726]|uniref:heavy-metal-associated domain-containing protein n=1 Tax=Agromyces sp. Marseille-P2726 TaxID=2709132 RepID=UPI00156E5E8B|nr:heavy-metal-associated domain-containing protein [Agromyces sp. Marseille-P2726]